MKSLISIQNVSKAFGKHKALNNVSLEIEKGEIFALLGPNGAGKTTLISAICGLCRQSTGDITVNSFNTVTHYKDTRNQIGLVPQELPLDGFESVYNSCQFSRGLFGLKDNRNHIENILKALSLFDKRDEQIFGLSGGMKRRLLIAKALAHEPKILFLDEPTAGVDVSLRRDIWKLIEDQKKIGVTIILTTHYIEEAEQLADRVGIINSGEIILVKEKNSLMSEFSKKTTFIRLNKQLQDHSFVKKNKNISVVENGMALKLIGINSESNELQVLVNLLSQKGIGFTEINTVDNSLEDIFLDLVKAK
ncbi:MAG: multidrug ABC transporter ATP-binding protein [Rhodobacterales bacterium TMED271]|nr:MAG: multidrug ABC transporter ATP-binding protein [Rhodobacterales bacterium TMED271]